MQNIFKTYFLFINSYDPQATQFINFDQGNN